MFHELFFQEMLQFSRLKQAGGLGSELDPPGNLRLRGRKLLLLMVLKSHSQPPGMYKTLKIMG